MQLGLFNLMTLRDRTVTPTRILEDTRLMVEGAMPLAGGCIGAEATVAWPEPTRPGDVLTVESEVVELIPSRSRPDRGIAVIRCTTKNQDGKVRQVLTGKMVVPRRPAT